MRGGHGFVGHRQQPHVDAPRPADLVGHRRRRRALGQPRRAVQVGGQVAVAEAEPRRSRRPNRRVARWRTARGASIACHALAGQAPAPLGVDGAGQRVRDGVEVGGDRQPVEHGVVAGVDDGRDRRRRRRRCTSPRRKRAAPTPPASTATDGSDTGSLIVPSPGGAHDGGGGGRVSRRRPPATGARVGCRARRAPERSEATGDVARRRVPAEAPQPVALLPVPPLLGIGVAGRARRGGGRRPPARSR